MGQCKVLHIWTWTRTFVVQSGPDPDPPGPGPALGQSNGYPIASKYSDIFDEILPKWWATPLPAFDTGGKFIKVHDLEGSLRGSLVLVYFELKHYSIRDKRMNAIMSNTVSAMATQVKVLGRGTERRASPYKSLMLKGPSFLPQSPSKKKDQTNAVNTFHPGKGAGPTSLTHLLTILPNSWNEQFTP